VATCYTRLDRKRTALSITVDIYTSLILELRTETADAAADLIPRRDREVA
jgi:hypothetical protein